MSISTSIMKRIQILNVLNLYAAAKFLMALKIAKNHIIGARGGVATFPSGRLKPPWRRQRENCPILIWFFGLAMHQHTIFGLIPKACFKIHGSQTLFFDFWISIRNLCVGDYIVFVWIWKPLKEKTNFFVRNVTDYFLQYYPNSIILPVRDQLGLTIRRLWIESIDPCKAIGNHEGVPVNQFEVGSNWLYEEIAEQWAKFNLHPDSFETIKRLARIAPPSGHHQLLSLSSVDFSTIQTLPKIQLWILYTAFTTWISNSFNKFKFL